MIYIYIDLEESCISVEDDKIEKAQVWSLPANCTVWADSPIGASEMQAASMAMCKLDLSELTFVLTDKAGTVYTSTMIGQFLPVMPSLESEQIVARCRRHGGKGIKRGEYCPLCFGERQDAKRFAKS
jgi:hypothetical protein